MALRLLQVSVGKDDGERLGDALEGQALQRLWLEPLSDGGFLARALVQVEDTEAITDLLTGRFSGSPDFHLLLLPVEAAYPIPTSEASTESTGSRSPTGRVGGEDPATTKPPPKRVSRDELYADAVEGAQLTTVYLVTVALSTVVAAVGLIRGDVAVIIGAMVIAPLLGPNVSMSLAWTLGDRDLAGRAVRTAVAGAALALFLSLTIGLLVPVDPAVPELVSRTRVGLADFALALAAGSAGALAYTAGLASAVVGVMVAVALLPPLVTAGLMVSSGNFQLAVGALLLAATNVVCLNLAGIATFLAQRVRPRTWWETKKAKRATQRAVASWVALLILLVVLILLGTGQG